MKSLEPSGSHTGADTGLSALETCTISASLRGVNAG